MKNSDIKRDLMLKVSIQILQGLLSSGHYTNGKGLIRVDTGENGPIRYQTAAIMDAMCLSEELIKSIYFH